MPGNPVPMMSEGVVFAKLSPQAKERVIKKVGEKAAHMFEIKKKAFVESLDFRRLRGMDKLAMYRAKSVQEWNALKTTFPEEYKKAIQEFYILERRIKASETATRQAGRTGGEETFQSPSPDIGV